MAPHAMDGRDDSVIAESIIPKGQALALKVAKGRTIRVIAHEGKQVADLYACALGDSREKFSSHATASASRSMRSASVLYSGPPFFEPLLTITYDEFGVHWIHGRCSPLSNRLRGVPQDRPTCHSNIVASLQPYGLGEYDVPLDTFNIFMNPVFDERSGFHFDPPVIGKGDHVDLRAEKDVLVSISACPQESRVNDFRAKPLTVQTLL